MTRIDVVAEGPEYWRFLYNYAPEVLLKLYNKYAASTAAKAASFCQ